jgi:hypothetical protein
MAGGVGARRAALFALGFVAVAVVVAGVALARRPDRAVVQATGLGPAGEATAPAAAPPSTPVPSAGPSVDDPALRTRPGTAVASGDRYRIDEIALDAPTTVVVDGQTVQRDAVLRITITGGPFPVRDAPAVIALDGTALAIATESVDLSTLVAFTFDEKVLVPGATLSFGYGMPDSTPAVWSAPVEVIR